MGGKFYRTNNMFPLLKWDIVFNKGKPTQHTPYTYTHTHTHEISNTTDEEKILKNRGKCGGIGHIQRSRNKKRNCASQRQEWKEARIKLDVEV